MTLNDTSSPDVAPEQLATAQELLAQLDEISGMLGDDPRALEMATLALIAYGQIACLQQLEDINTKITYASGRIIQLLR